jgi:hypothetical protein
METLKEIINKSKLTKKDRQHVLELAEQIGLKYNADNKCDDCIKEIAFSVIYYYEKHGTPEDPKTLGRKILIKENVNIIVNGVRVNRRTIDTDEKAQMLLNLGVNKKYFEFIENEQADNNEQDIV